MSVQDGWINQGLEGGEGKEEKKDGEIKENRDRRTDRQAERNSVSAGLSFLPAHPPALSLEGGEEHTPARGRKDSESSRPPWQQEVRLRSQEVPVVRSGCEWDISSGLYLLYTQLHPQPQVSQEANRLNKLLRRTRRSQLLPTSPTL